MPKVKDRKKFVPRTLTLAERRAKIVLPYKAEHLTEKELQKGLASLKN